MTKTQLMRLKRVQNILYLSLVSKSQGKEGWNITELAKLCDAGYSNIYAFVKQMIGFGYISKKGSLFTFSKIVSAKTAPRIATMIVENWGHNIYSTLAERLKSFSNAELKQELARRGAL